MGTSGNGAFAGIGTRAFASSFGAGADRVDAVAGQFSLGCTYVERLLTPMPGNGVDLGGGPGGAAAAAPHPAGDGVPDPGVGGVGLVVVGRGRAAPGGPGGAGRGRQGAAVGEDRDLGHRLGRGRADGGLSAPGRPDGGAHRRGAAGAVGGPLGRGAAFIPAPAALLGTTGRTPTLFQVLSPVLWYTAANGIEAATAGAAALLLLGAVTADGLRRSRA